MKLRTASHLHDFVDGDFAWRLKEIANIKTAVKAAKSAQAKTLVRAGLPLVYAHWEGFIKSAAEAYLGHVLLQRPTFDQLAVCFVALGARGQLKGFQDARKANIHIAVADYFIRASRDPPTVSFSTSVNTRANLNSEVFADIAASIGIDRQPYEAFYNLIDVSLLRRRNGIVHGEYLDVTGDQLRDLADSVLMLMRQFKDDVQNAALRRSYLT